MTKRYLILRTELFTNLLGLLVKNLSPSSLATSLPRYLFLHPWWTFHLFSLWTNIHYYSTRPAPRLTRNHMESSLEIRVTKYTWCPDPQMFGDTRKISTASSLSLLWSTTYKRPQQRHQQSSSVICLVYIAKTSTRLWFVWHCICTLYTLYCQ